MQDHSYDILDILDKYDGDIEAALKGESSPECLYALSPLRGNLIEWIEIEPAARVLEIGSGYGALTGILAGKAAEVVVIDPRDENLEVNRRRHGDSDNIFYVRVTPDAEDKQDIYTLYKSKDFSYISGDTAVQGDAGHALRDAARLMSEPFDYVVMAGTLGGSEKADAYDILSRAAKLLASGGKLIAAAENDAGVRYWMGAKQCETSFLESEFRGMFDELKNNFGGSYTMYYPVPDYRYPITVYSDDHLPETGDVTNISARYDAAGFRFGNEEEAMAKACRNGEFTKFANSFLGIYTK